VREIQDHILTSIINAKHKIVMVQPYYYPIRIFEDEIIRAMDRGVKVELITSAKRD
jgi:phosphatidylserine/phosphatidylglycerophosphate/cardiolipin synthase-like enzyme